MRAAGRLLRTGSASAPSNMAVDEVLARSSSDHPVLRFYAWDAPAVSFGYFQRSQEIDVAACRRSGIRLVRRPTGGRAVLHRRDLTYSVIIPLRPPWSGLSIHESYRRINACLERGLKIFGVSTSMRNGSSQAPRVSSPFCLSAVARDELLVGGKKVLGSAQRRFPTALLQQGSILLDFDPNDHFALLRGGERAAASRSFDLIGSLREALGWLPDRDEVESAISEGFAGELGIQFQEGHLDPAELTLADQLATSRYASEEWTFLR